MEIRLNALQIWELDEVVWPSSRSDRSTPWERAYSIREVQTHPYRESNHCLPARSKSLSWQPEHSTKKGNLVLHKCRFAGNVLIPGAWYNAWACNKCHSLAYSPTNRLTAPVTWVTLLPPTTHGALQAQSKVITDITTLDDQGNEWVSMLTPSSFF